MKLTKKRQLFVEALQNELGVGTRLSRPVAVGIAEKKGLGTPNWFLSNDKWRVGRGDYIVPALSDFDGSPDTSNVEAPADHEGAQNANVEVLVAKGEENSTSDLKVGGDGFSDNLVPRKDSLFVPFGFYKDLKTIIESKAFYPAFITGLSGNGKTMMPKQAAADSNREFIRVNISVDTDEDDLIGGFRLVNGETVFFKGPVIKAMERGAVLLLDEIDLGTPSKLMCLQSILEGEGYFIKKTGEYVNPNPGFTIIATANTKGKGSDTGQFVGTNILNEAFLERFIIMFEHQYPTPKVEKNILGRMFKSMNMDQKDPFIELLVRWAGEIRKSYYDDAVDEVITTRRLTHIAKTYAVFKDRYKAVQLCLNRFDDDTKSSFLDFYTKIDGEIFKEQEESKKQEEGGKKDDDSTLIPF